MEPIESTNHIIESNESNELNQPTELNEPNELKELNKLNELNELNETNEPNGLNETKEANKPNEPAESIQPTLPPLSQTEEELARRELSLVELVALMDEYKPLIPDALNDYYMAKAGLNCPDPRIKRVIALAAQKFIADVATDALHFCKLRQQAIQGRRPSKYVLSIEDLASALSEYGVQIHKPEYYS